MARIQVLELPAEVAGDCATHPFVLVIDRAEGSEFWVEDSGSTSTAPDVLELLRDNTGARAVLVIPGELEVG